MSKWRGGVVGGMMTRWRHFTVLVLGLLAANMACSISLGGPTPPASPIAVSTEAAGELESIWEGAISNANGGPISVVITEEQLTSYVALKLAESPNPILQDTQEYLRDGKMLLYGQATIKDIKAQTQVTIGVSTTAEGRLVATLEEADFGPVPVPASVLASLSDALNAVLTGQLGAPATGLTIQSVTIADGQMAISAILAPG